MERKNKKTLVLLFVLLLIFIFTLARALKPIKPRTITTTHREDIEQQLLSQKNEDMFDFQQLDASISKLQSIVRNIEQEQSQIIVIETKKNSFRQMEARVQSGASSEPVSILRQDYVEIPDFRISGIVYDKEKPMVVIDNEVKAENDTKDGYTIKKILADRVILKRDNKEFVLFSNSNSVDFTNSLNISDSTESNDTGIFSKESAVQPVISRNTEYETKQFSFVVEKSADSFIQIEKNRIFTIQLASFGKNKKKQAIEFAKKILDNGFENVRVEHINGMYTVRAGVAQEKDGLLALYEELKKYSDTLFVRSAYLVQSRIVYPPLTNINM
ncbi:MAG: SPOR domain-containing protein [Candidatus Omnitrophica bacterium]|nr:SPOR domain-containing protein [Candidatus Omnitrophota bacterium]